MTTPAERLRRGPFARLTAHFFHGFFDVELFGEGSRLGLGAILSILAFPGLVMSILLFDKYSSLLRFLRNVRSFDREAAMIPDKYTFIVFSMTVAGVLTVLRWEALLPERRDWSNLAPLPLSTRVLFTAKALALAAFIALFTLDLNAASTLLFPPIAIDDAGALSDLARFFAAHFAAVAAGTLFVFCALLALVGALVTLLPSRTFQKITRLVQCAAIASLLGMFFLTPLVLRSLPSGGPAHGSLLHWLPSVWFLGLYQSLHGSPSAVWQSLGTTAAGALGLAALAAVLFYGASHRAFARHAAEAPELARAGRRFPAALFALVDRIALRDARERGLFRFVLRTLARSRRHSAALAAFAGAGFALALQMAILSTTRRLQPNTLTLAPPLAIGFCLLAGLRFAFGVPFDPRATWLFQIAVAASDAQPARIARKVMTVTVALPLALVTLAVYTAVVEPALAAVHALVVFTGCLFLIDVLVVDFRSIPFTCANLLGGGNAVLGIAMHIIGLLVFVDLFAAIEMWIYRHPIVLLPVSALLGIVWFAIHRAAFAREPVVFESQVDRLELLRLSE